MAAGVDPDKLIERLSQQIGTMATQIVMLNLALEEAQNRIAELEPPAEPTPGSTP